uniref:Urotensin-2 receptor n=1 Tax=Paramormyrops kingsleyae TaxID=1676925 RepID=A0A3B3SEQ9_9TELE
MGSIEGVVASVTLDQMNGSSFFILNSSSLVPDRDPPVSIKETVITASLGIVLSLMCLVGVVGNVYTLVVMNISVRVSCSVHVYIVNLAVADLLYLSTIPFVVCTYFVKDWYFGEIGCRVLFSLDFLTMHASIFILTIMSSERYLAVVKPLDTFGRSRHYRRTVTCAVWLLSFFLALPNMIMIDLKRTVQNGMIKRMCHPNWQIKAYKIYLTVLFNTSILAPGIVIGCLYVRLARTYWIIVVTYCTCFLPFWLWQLLSIFYFGHGKLSHKTMANINFIVTCLAYSNSCINPFLYTEPSVAWKHFTLKVIEMQSSVSIAKQNSEQISLKELYLPGFCY